MNIQVSKVNDQIFLVQAKDQETLGKVFLRFQEHYESPEWKGKIFTIGQFRSWYSEKYGQNSYERDWSGFNIPSHILDPFIKGLFEPLTELEQEFVDLFKYRTDKFYIIGAQEANSSTLDHEICHGLFYTNEAYRDEVLKILKFNKKDLRQVYDYVAGMMYHPDVFDDEVHAYMSADYDHLVKDERVKAPISVHKKLRQIKNKYFKQD